MARGLIVAGGVVGMLAGCDLVLGLNRPPGVTPDALDAGADPGEPRVVVPALFPEHAPSKGPYLFEGTGAGTMALPVPVFVEPVGAADIVSVRVPSELGDGWRICDQPVTGGEAELVLEAPCQRTEASLAFTVVVPVSAADAADAISPLVVVIRRGDAVYELPITIVALDELVANNPSAPSDGLFSTISVAGFTPPKQGPAVTWRAMANVEIAGIIDVSGQAGASDSDAQCSNSGCAGGAAGPGNSFAGASSSSSCDLTGCSAAGIYGGKATRRCSNAGFCATAHTAGSGGAGGHTLLGGDGAPPENSACGGTSTGGAGGAADVDALVLVPVGGGSGAAGATMLATSTPDTTTIYGGGGGGGGGVITIDTLGQLRFAQGGEILASGGAGGRGGARSCGGYTAAQRAGDGGGGAGGAVRLLARSVDTSTSTVDLDLLVIAAGGRIPAVSTGVGAPGRIRIDAIGADSLDTTRPGVIRGPDFDSPMPIVTTDTVPVTARNRSVSDPLLYWGARSASSDTYALTQTTAGTGAVTLDVPLEPGLNEMCVFVGPQMSALVAEIPDAAKRCVWVARVQ